MSRLEISTPTMILSFELLWTQQRVHEVLLSEVDLLGAVQNESEQGDVMSLPLSPRESDHGVKENDVDNDNKNNEKPITP